MIGPYPFKKFAVVEGFLPTSYGCRLYAFGSAVMRPPSYGYLLERMAHNWWELVFMDSSGGNWSEAITTTRRLPLR
jgi:hypothetical protein